MASGFVTDGNTRFDYTCRVSTKARYAKLRIRPYYGLEVVIPLGFPKQGVSGLIRQHARWIERQLQKYQSLYAQPALPSRVQLPINQCGWDIHYGAAEQTPKAETNHLTINAESFDDRIKQLRQWVCEQAWIILPPMVKKLADASGLKYQKVMIRSQKTRWGSCSSQGTISLNDQLLFVSATTAEYLIIHELCHTRHMNHSAQFWQLVKSHCADYRHHESVLRQARLVIPEWFQYDLFR